MTGGGATRAPTRPVRPPSRCIHTINRTPVCVSLALSCAALACSHAKGSGATHPMAGVPRGTPRPRRCARSSVRLRHLRLGHHREQPLGHLLLDEAHRVLVRVRVRVSTVTAEPYAVGLWSAHFCCRGCGARGCLDCSGRSRLRVASSSPRLARISWLAEMFRSRCSSYSDRTIAPARLRAARAGWPKVGG